MAQKRFSMLSKLLAVGTFALAFRKAGKGQRLAQDQLKPRGSGDRKGGDRKGDGRTGGQRKAGQREAREPKGGQRKNDERTGGQRVGGQRVGRDCDSGDHEGNDLKGGDQKSTPHQLGHDATTPAEIPPRGWWAIAKRVVAEFGENELMSEAASVTFYALLSLAPAITALVSLYGLVSDPHTIQAQLGALSGVIPSGGMEIISEQVKRLIDSSSGGLSLGLAFGITTALWSANAATKAMISALNQVYEVREDRGFLHLVGISMAFTIGGLITMILGLVLVVVLPVIFKALGLDDAFSMAVQFGRVPIMLLVIVTALALLFRYGPNRAPPRWRWVTWGGAIGAVLWVALSVGFSWYVAHFGSYNKTYGSLGAVIGFMTWIWLSATVLLVGAQVNAEMERQTSRDTTTGAPEPMGERGAVAANHVA